MSAITRDIVFTAPDERLIREANRDPLGLQAVWSHFGQKVFHNKLTTIATDLRIYTINLTHVYVLDQLGFHQATAIDKLIQNQYKTRSALLSGLLIFLEDLLVYTLVKQEPRDFETMGIMGYAKGKRRSENAKSVFLEADSGKGILTRQISLGMTGRYKSPLFEMNIMQADYSLHSLNVDRIHRLFQQWPAGKALTQQLVQLLTDVISKYANPGKPIRVSLEDRLLHDLPALAKAYAKAFGTMAAVDANLKDFWLEMLGLTDGEPGFVYRSAIGMPENTPNYREQVFVRAARALEKAGKHAQNIDAILKIEPFLAQMDNAFNWLLLSRVRHADDVAKQLKAALAISDVEALDMYKSSPRLTELLKIWRQSKNSDQPHRQLAYLMGQYHKNIMEQRGSPAWLSVTDSGSVSHPGRAMYRLREEDLTDFDPGQFIHDYYLHTVNQLAQGLRHG
jgi:hypothetical protein